MPRRSPSGDGASVEHHPYLKAADDPLVNFQMEEGKRVRIGFSPTNEYGSICMKGRNVIITCIEELDDAASEDDR